MDNQKAMPRYHQLHRELWHWLLMNPEKDKKDWPRWKSKGGPISEDRALCFACLFSEMESSANGQDCSFCPIDWPALIDAFPAYSFPCERSHYYIWDKFHRLGELAEACEQARIIRDLPWQLAF